MPPSFTARRPRLFAPDASRGALRAVESPIEPLQIKRGERAYGAIHPGGSKSAISAATGAFGGRVGRDESMLRALRALAASES